MKLKEISDREVEEARNVLGGHVVQNITMESAIECGLWCIASQATHFEVACNFIYNLREMDGGDRDEVSSMDKLLDKGLVVQAAQSAKWRFAKGGRFDQFIDYFGKKKGDWMQEVVDADSQERRKIVSEVKWLAEKTYSFWHVCLGGKNLVALDTHVMRQSSLLGVNVPRDYYVPVYRESRPHSAVEVSEKFRRVNEGEKFLIPDGEMDKYQAALVPDRKKQKVRKSPNGAQYDKLEVKVIELFRDDERFLDSGKINAALVDAFLWWRGVQSFRSRENLLFGDVPVMDEFEFPYGSSTK